MMPSDFVCCFCKQSISKEDRDAVAIGITNLWRLDGGSQGLFAHSDCATKNLSQTGSFDPAVLNSN